MTTNTDKALLEFRELARRWIEDQPNGQIHYCGKVANAAVPLVEALAAERNRLWGALVNLRDEQVPVFIEEAKRRNDGGLKFASVLLLEYIEQALKEGSEND